MGDELENEIVESDIGSGEVTDDDLEAAFQQFMGNEEVIEEEQPQVNQPPSIEHSESSRIGRKVKYMEQQMVTKEELRLLDSKLDSLLTKLNREPEVHDEYDEYGNRIEKPVDIDAIVEQKIVQRETAKEREAKKAVTEYQNGYVEALRELINEVEDPTVAREVFKKMTEDGGECNRKYSQNPYKDASKNFVKAIKSVKTPFGGERGTKLPTGVSSITTPADSSRKMPKLDPEAAEYAKAMGFTEDEIIESLKGDVPDRLRGTKIHI